MFIGLSIFFTTKSIIKEVLDFYSLIDFRFFEMDTDYYNNCLAK